MSYVHPLLHGCVLFFFFFPKTATVLLPHAFDRLEKSPSNIVDFPMHISPSSMCHINSQCRELGQLYFKDNEGPLWDKPSLWTNPLWLGLTIVPKTRVFFFLINAGLYSSNIYSIQCLLAFMHEWIIIQWICMEHLLCGLQRYASSRGQCQNVWDDPWPQGN